MAFQFKRDRTQNLELILAGDIDLEVTPEIKNQLLNQLADAASLTINGSNISYLDSSGVSILIISMQNCKQKQLGFKISSLSDDAFRVLELARLDKILPIETVSGPAKLVDVDAFSGVSGADGDLANDLGTNFAKPTDMADEADDFTHAGDTGNAGDVDDDLIAALSADQASPAETDDALEETPEQSAAPSPELPVEAPVPEKPQPSAPPEPQPVAAPHPIETDEKNDDGGTGGSGGTGGPGGSFTPGTFG